MPRKPIGERPMTDAERQARCRAARESGTPAVRIRRPLDHRSRAKRWRDAVSKLTTLQGQYAAWLEALPENLQDSATAEALQAICDLDLTELQAIVPPRGFGRDRPARRPLGTRAGASKTAPDRPTSPAPHRTALAPAAQPRPAPPGRALPSAPFTRGVNFGRRSGVTFRRRLTIMQIRLPADQALKLGDPTPWLWPTSVLASTPASVPAWSSSQ